MLLNGCAWNNALVWQNDPEEHFFFWVATRLEILELKDQGLPLRVCKNVKLYFDQSKVFIAPLRYGAGMKGKIGQSMSFGLPVITTSIGAEGWIKNGKHVLISDDPEGIARNVDILTMIDQMGSNFTAGKAHGNYSPRLLVKIKDILSFSYELFWRKKLI